MSSSTLDTEAHAPSQQPALLGVSRLQLEMRSLFRAIPPHFALLKSLGLIGEFLNASYAAIHMRLGSQMLSEEYQGQNAKTSERLRDSTSQAMLDAMSTGMARCVRLGTDPGHAVAILSAVLYDSSLAQAGAAAMVVGPCDRQETLQKLSLFEGIMGFLSLLASDEVPEASAAAKGSKKEQELTAEAAKVSEHPVHLAFHIVAGLQTRYGLNQVAIGFVERDGSSIKVAAVSGFDELRRANPGLKLIKAAMEECLDRDVAVICHGSATVEGEVPEDDCRLHVQWSKALWGDTVASFPIRLGKKPVAVVSVCADASAGLQRKNLAQFSQEVTRYAPLIPLSNLAARGVVSHVKDVLLENVQKTLAPGGWKRLTIVGIFLVLVGWLAFGSLPYRLTVAAMVAPGDLRVISAPRDGLLLEFKVLPGARVQAGELLAVLDDREDQLRRAELGAMIAGMEVEADKALAGGLAADVRVLEARLRACRAELELVGLRIEQGKIRAPVTGTVLQGDLRTRVGSRVAMGESLFQLSGSNRVVVELQIPENRLDPELGRAGAVFAPSVRPHERIELSAIRLSPVSRVTKGGNTFLGESYALAEPSSLIPGMEGVAQVDLGWRSAWWVLTHRLVDWMRLRFWV